MLDCGEMTIMPSLSVFFPTFNEEANIKKTVLAAKKVLTKIADRWEILVINDGSSDRTQEMIRTLIKSDPRIKLINHPINRGYGASLKTGFYAAQYPWLAFTDSDGQFDFSEITRFLEKQKET